MLHTIIFLTALLQPQESQKSGLFVQDFYVAEEAVERGVIIGMLAGPSEFLIAQDVFAAEIRNAGRKGEFVVLRTPPSLGDLEFAQVVWATGLFKIVCPNLLHRPGATDPDDYYYVTGSGMWNHGVMESNLAWDYWTAGGGEIGVIDTGAQLSHEDFAGLITEGYNSVDMLEYSASPPGDISDVASVTQVWHGTRVSGIAAGKGDNNKGVVALCWTSDLRPIRATNSTSGVLGTDDIIEGMSWAGSTGVDVVNISNPIAAWESSGAAADAEAAYWPETIFVCISGNGVDDNNITDWDNLLIVVAVTQAGARFGNYGDFVDCAAPTDNGTGIWTTDTVANDTTFDLYTQFGGTSSAAPEVSSLLSLMMGANPYLPHRDDPSLSYGSIESRMLASCVDIGTTGEDIHFGAGRINAKQAIEAVLYGDMVLSVTCPS